MTRAATLTERQEYLEGGLAGLSCDRCGALVRVRKSSPQQTSVQWTTLATSRCETLAGDDRPHALVPTCPALRATIDRAVRTGRLGVS